MIAPAASVVVPAHQKARSLPAVLTGLRQQDLTAGRFEVIVVDDGSTDGTAELLAAAELGDHPLQVVRRPTAGGAAAARNDGLDRARSELTIFLDGDVVPGRNLVRAHLDAQAGGPVATVGLTYGREATPGSWLLAAGPAGDWDFTDPDEVLRRAAAAPGLTDPLTRWLEGRRLPSPWTYFWTTNVGVPTGLARSVGGFDTGMAAKGNEDVEFGYRLHRAGCPIEFLRSAPAMHQPHPRDRPKELVQDRENGRRLLARHPTLEVEAACAFDLANANPMTVALRRWSTRPDAGRYRLPAGFDPAGAAGPVLVIGAGRGPYPDLRPHTVIDVVAANLPAVAAAYPAATVRHLLGARLPFRTGEFGLAVISALWRELPERLLARVLEEACRVADRVWLLSDDRAHPPVDPDFAAAVDRYDRPFWEHTITIRRELHDFAFALFRPLTIEVTALARPSYPPPDPARKVG
jgi:glycosyltransferase involved in cell wall biosynthesis